MQPIRKENNDLVIYRFNKEIIDAVIAQLEKDIVLCGGAITLSEKSHTDLELLKSEVQDYISNISAKNPSLLFNLLYRIDIPQKMIEQQNEEMGTLILKRELTKVLIRASFKNSENI